MAGYFENSRSALLKEARARHASAATRALRWKQSYGEVGCYPDLVKTMNMTWRVVEVIEKER